jgi:NhaP-type Na+/H+ or K+/H+ antiporter
MEEEENFNMLFLIVLCVVFLSLMVLYLYSKITILERFPECMVAILLGISIGLYIRYGMGYTDMSDIVDFEPKTYFLLLLPPIMFQVGFSMNSQTFFRNIMTINAYAIGATFMSSFIFGVVLYYSLGFTSLSIKFMDCFQLGCIVSAIDPVATMSIFKNLNLNEKIYMYIFGESTLNNAVAIAI